MVCFCLGFDTSLHNICSRLDTIHAVTVSCVCKRFSSSVCNVKKLYIFLSELLVLFGLCLCFSSFFSLFFRLFCFPSSSFCFCFVLFCFFSFCFVLFFFLLSKIFHCLSTLRRETLYFNLKKTLTKLTNILNKRKHLIYV